GGAMAGPRGSGCGGADACWGCCSGGGTGAGRGDCTGTGAWGRRIGSPFSVVGPSVVGVTVAGASAVWPPGVLVGASMGTLGSTNTCPSLMWTPGVLSNQARSSC